MARVLKNVDFPDAFEPVISIDLSILAEFETPPDNNGCIISSTTSFYC